MARRLCYEVWVGNGVFGSRLIASFYVYHHAEKFVSILHSSEEVTIVDRS